MTELSFAGEWQKNDWPDDHTQDATERGTFVLALHGPDEVVCAGRALTARLPLDAVPRKQLQLT